MYSIIKDEDLVNLVKKATTSSQGRQFWTGGQIEEAKEHLKNYPNDVCMVRYDTTKIVLLGGPIPQGKLVDVTHHDFSDIADSFDVGFMTNLVEQWFKKDFNKEVTINILESGEMISGLSCNSKLISLSRKSPALLDMATTEDGRIIGQYNNTRGNLGHSGDCQSNIGGVDCLHHECPMKPSSSAAVKFYFLAGYSCKPLKAWRDSRVFWIVYDPDQERCWLVPHDLSHNAVGDTVSATMPLVSKLDSTMDSIHVMHLSSPVQATLSSASPLIPGNNQAHREYLQRCMEEVKNVDWMQSSSSSKTTNEIHDFLPGEAQKAQKAQEEIMSTASSDTNIDRTIAIFDNCGDSTLINKFPQTRIIKGKSLSPMHGPLKVLASGCCANSRVVIIDANSTTASSEINSLSKQISGIILVKTNHPDIFKLDQIRWNMARGPLTPVLALTPDGCKHLCGPMPPTYEDEECPTPVAGSPISDDALQEIIEFAFSPEGGEYFGPLYQPVPSFKQTEQAILDFISDMKKKDFRPINGKDFEGDEDSLSFTDDDFRRLMNVINTLSVSLCTGLERNDLAIRLTKFFRKMSKKTATVEIESSPILKEHFLELEILKDWNGENVDWAIERKDVLEDLLKGNINIVKQEGVEIDLGLTVKLDDAIKKKRAELNRKISTLKSSTSNGWKRMFNAVFRPALEALMVCINGVGNPRYLKYFPEVRTPNMSGVIIHASQSTSKLSVATNPEDVMKLFHKMGATGFVSFTINFLQTWKTKVINEICIVDQPGEGFNNPETYVPVTHRLEDGPADVAAAYETDIRHQFVLPTFVRLPKMTDGDDDDSDDDDSDDGLLHQMPMAPAEDDLAKYVLMRAEFMLRDPEQGPRHPMWRYVDWLFHQIKTLHQVNEKQAAPLAMRALGFSISRLMKDHPNPDKATMEIVASIMQAISFMSARGDPSPHGCIDTFFNMSSTYVPQTKDMERNPWQIEIINILSRAVDYICPILSEKEYVQIRANFQRAAANMVKRQIVQKLLEDVREEAKKNMKSHDDYLAQVNNEFYPAYREVVELIGTLIEADPETFELTDEISQRIDVLYQTIVSEWAGSMRRCRIGPVRKLVDVLKTFSKKGQEAMKYLVSRKKYLQILYDQVYHIKYESCDHILVEEVCKIIRAKGRNPEHEKHQNWLARVNKTIQDISTYDERMEGFAHGNKYKQLPTNLMLKILSSLKDSPISDNAVTFKDVKSLLAHINIDVEKPKDLKTQPIRFRGNWWMCSGVAFEEKSSSADKESIPSVAMISMDTNNISNSSNILATLGDTYHKFRVARLYSGEMKPMRNFIRENYKFHLEWFEETIRAAGLPQYFDPNLAQSNELIAIYAVVQRLVDELVQDESDRGEKARDKVYGEILQPMNSSNTPLPETKAALALQQK